jgi:hypothetical protein
MSALPPKTADIVVQQPTSAIGQKQAFAVMSALSLKANIPGQFPFKATHHKSDLFNVAPSWEVDALELVAEHIRDALLFEQMAKRSWSRVTGQSAWMRTCNI